MDEWLKRVEHVQPLVGGAVKYYLPTSVAFLKSADVFWIPNGKPVDILQVWEETLAPQLIYGSGFAFIAKQVFVCRGGRIQVDLHDGREKLRVSLTYGHVLYIPPCLWYQYFTKNSGVRRKEKGILQIFTDACLEGDWFQKMDSAKYAAVREQMNRR